MTPLNLQLQEQYVCYCAEWMSQQPTNIYFPVLEGLATTLKANNFQPTDLVTVIIDPNILIGIFLGIGERSEIQTNSMHAAIKTEVIAELTAQATGTDVNAASSAGYVLTQLQSNQAGYDASNQSRILTGRNFLKQ